MTWSPFPAFPSHSAHLHRSISPPASFLRVAKHRSALWVSQGCPTAHQSDAVTTRYGMRGPPAVAEVTSSLGTGSDIATMRRHLVLLPLRWPRVRLMGGWRSTCSPLPRPVGAWIGPKDYVDDAADEPQVYGIATVFEGSKIQIYWFDTRGAKEYL
jgi:hypothetical protein